MFGHSIYKQLCLTHDFENNNELITGKTVKHVFLSRDKFIIMFTDNSYISLATNEDDDIDNTIEYALTDKGIKDYFENPIKSGYFYKDENGEFHFKHAFGSIEDQLAQAGILKVSQEAINREIAERKKFDDDEYVTYIRLKKKFEK